MDELVYAPASLPSISSVDTWSRINMKFSLVHLLVFIWCAPQLYLWLVLFENLFDCVWMDRKRITRFNPSLLAKLNRRGFNSFYPLYLTQRTNMNKSERDWRRSKMINRKRFDPHQSLLGSNKVGMAILPAATDIRGFRTRWVWIRVRNLAHG